MEKLSQQEQLIWEEASRLYQIYSPMIPDGHSIFQIAMEIVRRLSMHYKCPLAYGITQALIRDHVARYCAASGIPVPCRR